MQIKTIYSEHMKAWWYYVTDPINPDGALLVSPAIYADEQAAYVAGELSQVSLKRIIEKWSAEHDKG